MSLTIPTHIVLWISRVAAVISVLILLLVAPLCYRPCYYVCPLAFTVIGLAFSFFYGWKAFDIFRIEGKDMPPALKFHQFWLNFLGSIVGWLMLWVALRRLGFVIASPDHPLKVSDFILLLVAFIGVTGYLPFAILTSVQAIKELISKIPGLK